ncbi:hypothetical protein [Bacillus thermotolerans]|uniref:Uncharacterized protein n=1 Tax=Bacillus thermotolerans TaxID=1221996 RepID=A0A0F5HVF4_BACTR|nr:hypothetical protein [Bacillus thermotolerans]KKB33748.1 hypothetical protein QY95_00036 [Bacillus thermotolerans]KKB36832.1 hypothetical protein QY95_02906 [Bacillus thermotolerans]
MEKLKVKEQILLAYYTQYNIDVSKMYKVHLELSKKMDVSSYRNAMIQLGNERLIDGIVEVPIPGSPAKGIKVMSPMITPEGIQVVEELLDVKWTPSSRQLFYKFKVH